MKTSHDEQELLKAMREGLITPERSREYWGEEEAEQIVNLYTSGMGISEIALELQRSEMAVVQRLITEGLFTPPGTERKRKPKAPRCLCNSCPIREACEQEGCQWREGYAGNL